MTCAACSSTDLVGVGLDWVRCQSCRSVSRHIPGDRAELLTPVSQSGIWPIGFRRRTQIFSPSGDVGKERFE